MYAVGVGKGAERSELLEIASGPGNVLSTSSFDELQKIASELRRQFCEGNYNWCTGTSTLGTRDFFLACDEELRRPQADTSSAFSRRNERRSREVTFFKRLHRNRKPRMKSLWHPG